jgi:hypothetical protein
VTQADPDADLIQRWLQGGDARFPEAVAREPGPAEAAAFVDQIEALLQGLPPLYAPLLELPRQGQDVTATRWQTTSRK